MPGALPQLMAKGTGPALCALALVVLTACGAATRAAVRMGAREPSKVWAGYIVAGHYTHVSASWVQPAVDCSVAPTVQAQLWEGSSSWAGLDGYFGIGRDTVEQTGTTAYCYKGKPLYRAWFQFYPGANHAYVDRVKPGDAISASVTADGNGRYTINLADPSEGWSHSKSETESGPGWPDGRPTSAEVIAEAPTAPYGWYPPTLADFGTVPFTNAIADGTPFDDLNGLHPIEMVAGGKLKAAPSRMTNGAFTVTWKHS